MNSSISMRNSVVLDWKPIVRSKNMPLKPISLDASLWRKKINSNSCYVRLGGFGGSSFTNDIKNKRRVVVCSIDPSSSGASSGNWKGWVLGFVISIILPFFTTKLGPLEMFKKKFDAGLQRIEDTVEEGEKIAEVVEKEAEKWLDRLPEGWLKDALSYIEQGAEKTVIFLTKVDNAIDDFQEEEERIEKSIASKEDKSKDSEEEEEDKK